MPHVVSKEQALMGQIALRAWLEHAGLASDRVGIEGKEGESCSVLYSFVEPPTVPVPDTVLGVSVILRKISP